MTKAIDISGKRFGRLIAIRPTKKRSGTMVVWECVCDCGNVTDVDGGSLRKGHTSSCGCYQKQRSSDSSIKNLKGMIFGKLLVLNSTNLRSDEKVIWLCKCECGNTTHVTSANLTKGHTKSCGCMSESFIASEIKRISSVRWNGIPEYRACVNPETNFYLPYDVFIGSHNLYIEVQGEQHYEKNYFHNMNRNMSPEDSLAYQKKKDLIKAKYARKNGTFMTIDLRKIKSLDEAIFLITEKLDKIKEV